MHRPTRQEVVFTALSLLGTPYQYGGQLYRGGYGTDCSGLVADAFHRAGAVVLGVQLGDGWASSTFATLPRVEQPLPGDLWCYPGHVTLHLGSVQFGTLVPTEDLLLNASGGGKDVVTIEEARRRRARVVLLSVADYHRRRPPLFAVSLARFYAGVPEAVR
jgi:hypothetical protein